MARAMGRRGLVMCRPHLRLVRGLAPDSPSGELVTWRDVGMSEWWATQWVDASFTPAEVLAWKHFSHDASVAAEWRDAGFTPDEAYVWMVREYLPEEAAYWRDAGCGPEENEPFFDSEDYRLMRIEDELEAEWQWEDEAERRAYRDPLDDEDDD